MSRGVVYYDLIEVEGLAPAYVFWSGGNMVGLYFKVSGKGKLEDFLVEMKRGFKNEDFLAGDGSFWPEKIKSGDFQFVFGGSALETRVWTTLGRIPKGETWSYKQVAEAAGMPRAVRAVASAIGRNRLSLIIPCHRVIRADGTLGEYGFGVSLKKKILENEGYKIKK